MSLENPYAALQAAGRGADRNAALFVDCDCGQRLAVEEAQAGSILTCPCGKSVVVPRLGVLRSQAGLSAYKENSAELIVRLVRSSELPEEKQCIDCGKPTDSIATGDAHCEQLWRKRESAAWGEREILLLLFVRLLFPIYLLLIRRRTKALELGRDKTAPIRLRLCDDCQRLRGERSWQRLPKWPTLCGAAAGLICLWQSWSAALLIWVLTLAYDCLRVWASRLHQRCWKALLRVVPVYADLLDEFPETEIEMKGIL